MYIMGCAEFSVMPQACIPFSVITGICFSAGTITEFLHI